MKISEINKRLSKILDESKIERDNVFDLKGDILFDNIAGGLSFSIDKETGSVSISTYLSETGGKGNFKVENGGNSQEELKALYDNLKDELTTLSQTVDDSMKQVLAKYGLKETL